MGEPLHLLYPMNRLVPAIAPSLNYLIRSSGKSESANGHLPSANLPPPNLASANLASANLASADLPSLRSSPSITSSGCEAGRRFVRDRPGARIRQATRRG